MSDKEQVLGQLSTEDRAELDTIVAEGNEVNDSLGFDILFGDTEMEQQDSDRLEAIELEITAIANKYGIEPKCLFAAAEEEVTGEVADDDFDDDDYSN